MRLEMIIGANSRQRYLIDGEEVPDDDFLQALGLISGHSACRYHPFQERR